MLGVSEQRVRHHDGLMVQIVRLPDGEVAFYVVSWSALLLNPHLPMWSPFISPYTGIYKDTLYVDAGSFETIERRWTLLMPCWNKRTVRKQVKKGYFGVQAFFRESDKKHWDLLYCCIRRNKAMQASLMETLLCLRGSLYKDLVELTWHAVVKLLLAQSLGCKFVYKSKLPRIY